MNKNSNIFKHMFSLFDLKLLVKKCVSKSINKLPMIIYYFVKVQKNKFILVHK